MRKEIRTIQDGGIVRVTTVDERWYGRTSTDPLTALPTLAWVPSVTWIAGHYPKGIGFYKWLASTGWDEAESIKTAAGDKGSRVHHAIVDLIDGHEVPMEAKIAGSDGLEVELSLEEYDCLRSFCDFWATHKPVTMAREVTVFGDGYAGTVDWVGMLTAPPKGYPAGPWLLDWKTSKEVWPEYELQVSAYAHAELGMGILQEGIMQLGILQLGYRRNKAGWKLTPVPDQYPLFLAAKQIWAKETEGQAPLQRDYPMTLRLP